jgi:aldehyde:ferredoxin oxidoreductase
LSTSLAGLTTEQAKEVFVRGNLKYFGVRDATDLSGEPKTWNNKVATAILMEKYSVNVDCITMCCWAGFPAFYSQYTPDYLGDPASGAKVYSAVTGIEMSNAEMIAAMDPIFNLERSIFVREGRRRVHDTFNDVIYTRAPWSWTSKAEFEGKVMDEYYTARGWDLKTGIPRRSTLEKLGLKSVADELESKYKVTVPA